MMRQPKCTTFCQIIRIHRFLNFFLNHIEKSFSPDLIIIGGGISKKMNLFENYIKINTPILPAKLKNNAGIVGAAIFAKRNFKI